ncbi:hypothetical protein V6N12_074895 [Hibiscus sabdariffa]|uniref:Uncharacterized protein n=1 Tax=Hibiscus sabdariffa TaxID=183260 RepID=A0ABR2D2R0_9ROSI
MSVEGPFRFAVLEDMQVENGTCGGVDVQTVMEHPRPAHQVVERKNGVAIGSAVVSPKEFTPREAYLVSNLGKKKNISASKKAIEVEVIPPMEDQIPKTVVHLLDHVKGAHTAVAIIETPLYGKGSVEVRIGKSHGVVNKSFKENSRRGIKRSM